MHDQVEALWVSYPATRVCHEPSFGPDLGQSLRKPWQKKNKVCHLSIYKWFNGGCEKGTRVQVVCRLLFGMPMPCNAATVEVLDLIEGQTDEFE